MAIPSRERSLHEQRLDEKVKSLPWYVVEYVDSMTGYSPSTLLQYVHDFEKFFSWLKAKGIVNCENIKDIPIETLETLKKSEVENYIKFLRREKVKISKEIKKEREENSIVRKVTSLKSLFKYLTTKTEDDEGECYFYRNVFSKITIKPQRQSHSNRTETIRSDLIINRLEFLSFVEQDYEKEIEGTRRVAYFRRDKERDIAILSLFLGTGARVSDLTSMTLQSINFKTNKINVIRKGNLKDTLRVTASAMDDIRTYLDIRDTRYKGAQSLPHLFVTLQNGKASPLSIRAIQEIVRKYTKAYFSTKSIFPHKLRHSFATDYIERGGSLSMLRKQLGHSSISTTADYVNESEEEEIRMMEIMDEPK